MTPVGRQHGRGALLIVGGLLLLYLGITKLRCRGTPDELESPTGAHVPELRPLAYDPSGFAPQRAQVVVDEDQRVTTLVIDADDAWRGSPDSKVAVVVFGDFQSVDCRRASADLARVYAAYDDRVLFVYKHFPFDPACNPGVDDARHLAACDAAKAAVCAHQQGRFWAFHDAVLADQPELARPMLREHAGQLGLDLAEYDACLGDQRTLEQVQGDAELGAQLDIHGTPRVYVNGKLLHSVTAFGVVREIELAFGADEPTAFSRATEFERQPSRSILQP